MNQSLRRFYGFLFLIAISASPVLASTIMKMELPELVAAADSIVQGRVESVEARWEQKRVFTYISIAVVDPLKGDRRRAILVRQPGGKIGGMNVWIAGMPQFKIADQVVVFLRNRQDGTFDVVGLNQGKYEIVNDLAVANVSGVTLVDGKTGQLSDGAFVEKAPLETFKARIRELVR